MTIRSGSDGEEHFRDPPASEDLGDSPAAAANPEQRLLGQYPFSGADIKLIVHLPQGEGDGASAEVQRLERELQEAQAALEQSVGNGPSPDALASLEFARQSREEALSELAGLSALPEPTPEDEERMAFLQHEIAGYSTTIQELTQRVESSGVSSQARAQLETTRQYKEEALSELAGLSALPDLTPEDEERMTFLQHEIAGHDATIRELTQQISSAEAPTQSREELERAIQLLRQQLEDAQGLGDGRPLVQTKVLAEISTLSWSIHREKFPVRNLGTTYARSYTRGPRTISGSIVFAAFNKHLFYDLFEVAAYRSTGVGDWDRFQYSSFLADQLPPMDISIVFANEYGNFSWMALLGVELVNEGGTMSIEDLFVEGVSQYVARDIDVMRDVGRRPIYANRGVGQDLTGTSILHEPFVQRAIGRNIPWI